MSEIDALLSANQEFARARARIGDGRPGRRLAVITCMDVRIDVLPVLGLHVGDAHVLRNAGGRVTEDVLRSLALSTHVLGVETVVVMQHTKCGLTGVTDDELRRRTGADLPFYAIDSHEAALRQDIDTLATTPYLDGLDSIAGFIYDVDTGAIEHVTTVGARGGGGGGT